MMLGGGVRCERFAPVVNSAGTARSVAYVAAASDAATARAVAPHLDVLGWYHTHCASAAVPGFQDLRNGPPSTFQMIISSSDVDPSLGAWWVDRLGHWMPVEVVEVVGVA